MRLPNPERAVVQIEKLRDYCLSPAHPRGRNKARVFESALGITTGLASALRNAILDAARTTEAIRTERDDFGQRYMLDFMMSGPKGRAWVRSSWIVRRGEDFPRLTSCYVL